MIIIPFVQCSLLLSANGVGMKNFFVSFYMKLVTDWLWDRKLYADNLNTPVSTGTVYRSSLFRFGHKARVMLNRDRLPSRCRVATLELS